MPAHIKSRPTLVEARIKLAAFIFTDHARPCAPPPFKIIRYPYATNRVTLSYAYIA